MSAKPTLPGPSSAEGAYRSAARAARDRGAARAREVRAARRSTTGTRRSRSRTTTTCVPPACSDLRAEAVRWSRRRLQTYAMVAAEIGRHCGATALTWNMHVCTTLWSGILADELDLTREQREEHERHRAIHFERIVRQGKVYAQPFSEGGAAAAGKAPFGTLATKVDGGWVLNGKKIFASLSGAADYYGVLCTQDRPDRSMRDTLYMAVPADAPGLSVTGDWDPLGMRGTVTRTLLSKGAVPTTAQLMPARRVLRRPRRACRTCSRRCRRPTWASRRPRTTSPSSTCAARCPGCRRSSAGCIRPSRSPWQRCASCSSRPARSSCAPATRGSTRQGRPPALLRAHYTIMESANDSRASRFAPAAASRCSSAAARAHLPRFALRLADAAVDRRTVPRPPRARVPLRIGRAR